MGLGKLRSAESGKLRQGECQASLGVLCARVRARQHDDDDDAVDHAGQPIALLALVVEPLEAATSGAAPSDEG
eukprot:75736-Pleurochrysis_carterae.AAC.1